jgi:hypothetical protein
MHITSLDPPQISKTDPFQSPESREKGKLSFKNDVYGLGALAVFLLTEPCKEAELMARIAKKNYVITDKNLKLFV